MIFNAEAGGGFQEVVRGKRRVIGKHVIDSKQTLIGLHEEGTALRAFSIIQDQLRRVFQEIVRQKIVSRLAEVQAAV